ncbi:hypothetical protein GCM10010156_06180 [Planobispora rosea]|uniref:Uncharacterized protein n=1 Tax=Planobispora rosea TaxID=35762 RepID=A0A8J3WA75_PLARO|nr:hypothetical protein [Planobispora rosea]GGS50227.1 hypothetical protein GCM10010156_06180 [Planobispora rosea]GIH82489.1 hypothetical protein Pro02_08970 [Planobispora rosea]
MSHSVSDRRTWADAQLVEAVSNASSWRGVLRLLDLKANSAGSIRAVRRHAERLELDTGHFVGQRRWRDEDFARAVREGRSWNELCNLLGLCPESTPDRAVIKAHAVRLGLDLDRFDGRGSGAGEAGSIDPLSLEPDLSRLRSAGLAIATAWFALRGCAAALPVEPQPYDLLVDVQGAIKRVQVKTTGCMSADGWIVNVGRHAYSG